MAKHNKPLFFSLFVIFILISTSFFLTQNVKSDITINWLNGDFETGSLSPYYTKGSDSAISNAVVHSGTYSAYLGSTINGWIMYNFTTNNGYTPYVNDSTTISFWYSGSCEYDFLFTDGNTSLGWVSDAGWHNFAFSLTNAGAIITGYKGSQLLNKNISAVKFVWHTGTGYGYGYVDDITFNGNSLGTSFITSAYVSANSPNGCYVNIYDLNNGYATSNSRNVSISYNATTDFIQYNSVTALGCKFDHWVLSNGTILYSTTITSNGGGFNAVVGVPTSITAYFTYSNTTQYQIISSCANGINLTPLGTEYFSYGASITYNFVPNLNYYIDSVSVNGSIVSYNHLPNNVGSYTFTNITGNSTIYISSSYQQTALISISVGLGSGNIQLDYTDTTYGHFTYYTGSSNYIPVNTVISISGNAGIGYQFDNFSVSSYNGQISTYYSNPQSLTVVNSGNITINFKLIPNGGGLGGGNTGLPFISNAYLALIIYIGFIVGFIVAFYYLHNNNIPFAIGLGVVVGTIISQLLNLLGAWTYPIDALTIMSFVVILVFMRH